jgi:hypothetical protein
VGLVPCNERRVKVHMPHAGLVGCVRLGLLGCVGCVRLGLLGCVGCVRLGVGCVRLGLLGCWLRPTWPVGCVRLGLEMPPDTLSSFRVNEVVTTVEPSVTTEQAASGSLGTHRARSEHNRVLADARAASLLALASFAVVLADARAAALLAPASSAVVLADA